MHNFHNLYHLPNFDLIKFSVKFFVDVFFLGDAMHNSLSDHHLTNDWDAYSPEPSSTYIV